ncbi:MAG: hypothetical protein R3336_00885 [Phycisphaeraceae bacterium]|nr:hypothetical protein [Phycisphaeraceae bacterium]
MLRKFLPYGTHALLALCGLMLVIAPMVARAYPEPSIVPRSWSLEFEYQHPQLIAVEDLNGRTQWFWYIAYKVVNETDREQLFIPEFHIATDEGDLITANEDIPTTVFKAIRKREGNKLMESPVQAIGQLLIGEDHAKESAIIWPVFDHDVDVVDVFIAGLNGEAQRYTPPGAEEPIIVRKTLMLTYKLPGNPNRIQDMDAKFHDEDWIMR